MEIDKITQILKPYLKDYQTTKDILTYLKSHGIELNSRDFQEYVLIYNSTYSLKEMYLVGCNRGYKFTHSLKEIKDSNMQKLKKAVSMIKNAKRDLQEIGCKSQLTLLDDYCDGIGNWVDTVEAANDLPHEEYYEETKLGGVYW